MNAETKKVLYTFCTNYVNQRVQTIENAMEDTQASANNETKSTAGDKHDTARAMMQLATEQNAKHLAEARKLKQVLHLIDPNKKNNTVKLGSVVQTENGSFFIAVSAGKVEHDGVNYFMVSPTSPIGLAMNGLKAGESFTLNGKTNTIKALY